MSDKLSVGVLSFHNSKETKCILNCIRKMGCDAYWIAESNISIHTKGGVSIKPDVDAVINRLLLSTVDRPAELLGIASAISESVPVLNNPKNVLLALNKISSTAKISSKEGVQTPESLFADDYYRSEFMEDDEPYVKKDAIGTHGDGTIIVHSSDEVFSSRNGSTYSLVQERIQQSQTSDVRVYVVDGEVIASMSRKPSGNEWRANIARGGKAEKVEIPESLRRSVVEVCEDFGLDYAGVDIMKISEGEWKFLEVNPTAGFKGLFSATGISPAPHIASLGIKEAGGNVSEEKVEELSTELYDSQPPAMPKSQRTEEKPVLGLEENILLAGKDKTKEVTAKIDTGSDRTSIDTKVVAEVGLGPIREYSRVRTASSEKPRVRPVVPASLRVAGMRHEVQVSVEDRSEMSCQVILGRDVLSSHRINPTHSSEE